MSLLTWSPFTRTFTSPFTFHVTFGNYKEESKPFIENKLFFKSEIQKCLTYKNSDDYIFKEHFKIAKVYIVKFDIAVLNMFKIMDFL